MDAGRPPTRRPIDALWYPFPETAQPNRGAMQVTASNFTVAEYCEQMRGGGIVVNHDYQRSDKVWPPAARSYLIETILLGYPMPKLALHQTTDLKTRRTKKEIVDGQQRSQAIFDFFEDKLRLSGNTEFARRTYSQLDLA